MKWRYPSILSSDTLPPSVYPTNVGEVLISVPAEHRDEALRVIAMHRAEGDAMGELGTLPTAESAETDAPGQEEDQEP